MVWECIVGRIGASKLRRKCCTSKLDESAAHQNLMKVLRIEVWQKCCASRFDESAAHSVPAAHRYFFQETNLAKTSIPPNDTFSFFANVVNYGWPLTKIKLRPKFWTLAHVHIPVPLCNNWLRLGQPNPWPTVGCVQCFFLFFLFYFFYSCACEIFSVPKRRIFAFTKVARSRNKSGLQLWKILFYSKGGWRLIRRLNWLESVVNGRLARTYGTTCAELEYVERMAIHVWLQKFHMLIHI